MYQPEPASSWPCSNPLHPTHSSAGLMDAVFGFADSIGAAEYISVPIATKLATDRPDLYEEFEAKVASKPDFAKNSGARLDGVSPASFINYGSVQIRCCPSLD